MNEFNAWVSINSFSDSLSDTGSHEYESRGLNMVLEVWPASPLQWILLTMLPIFGMSRNRSRVWNFWFSSWNSSMCLFLVCMTFCNGKGWWEGGWSSIKLITIVLYQETHCLLPHWKKHYHWKTLYYNIAFQCFKIEESLQILWLSALTNSWWMAAQISWTKTNFCSITSLYFLNLGTGQKQDVLCELQKNIWFSAWDLWM